MRARAIVKGYANKIIPLDGLASYLVSNYGAERSSSEKFEKERQARKERKDPVSSSRT